MDQNGKLADAIGTLFWVVAFAAFTMPVWLPFVAIAIGSLLALVKD